MGRLSRESSPDHSPRSDAPRRNAVLARLSSGVRVIDQDQAPLRQVRQRGLRLPQVVILAGAVIEIVQAVQIEEIDGPVPLRPADCAA